MYDNITRELWIGYEGEQYSRAPTIEIAELLAELPGAEVTLLVRRPREEEAYAAQTALSGTVLTWTVVGSDVAYPGTGDAQVLLVKQIEGGAEARLYGPHIAVHIGHSIMDITGEAPQAYDSYIWQVQGVG